MLSIAVSGGSGHPLKGEALPPWSVRFLSVSISLLSSMTGSAVLDAIGMANGMIENGMSDESSLEQFKGDIERALQAVPMLPMADALKIVRAIGSAAIGPQRRRALTSVVNTKVSRPGAGDGAGAGDGVPRPAHPQPAAAAHGVPQPGPDQLES